MVEYRLGLKYMLVFLVFLHEPSLIIAQHIQCCHLPTTTLHHKTHYICFALLQGVFFYCQGRISYKPLFA